MQAGGRGSIVNLSGGGATAPRPNFTAYGTSKAALVRFSETLAREVESSGIRVNCVAPGGLNTDMLREVLAAGPGRVGPEYERALRRDKDGGDPPEQAAALVAFLLSDLSAPITGRLLSAVWDPWRTLHLDDLRDTDLYTLRRVAPTSGRKE
jgi:3-oxoacyl-[acyl-carrier protein] reductase